MTLRLLTFAVVYVEKHHFKLLCIHLTIHSEDSRDEEGKDCINIKFIYIGSACLHRTTKLVLMSGCIFC